MPNEDAYLKLRGLLKVIPTSGSGPLLCSLSDNEEYYCKKSNFADGCKYDLVNEVISIEVLRSWGVFTSAYQFATIGYSDIAEELDAAYKVLNSTETLIQIKNPFNEKVFSIPFFACRNFSNTSYLFSEKMPDGIFKEYKVENTKDLFTILLFDLWFHNADRKPSNANTLIVPDENGRKKIVPIDNVQCFGVNRKFGLDSLAKLHEPLSFSETLFAIPAIKSLLLSFSLSDRKSIIDKSTKLFQIALSKLEAIKTGLMPVEWKADNYVDAIIALLGNDDRNNKILKRYTEILLQ